LARSIFKMTENSFTLGILGTLEHFRHSKGDCAQGRVFRQPLYRLVLKQMNINYRILNHNKII
jgi:hypothetical protein